MINKNSRVSDKKQTKSSVVDHLSRHFLLDVTADGAVFVRERGGTGGTMHGGLPVFSTDTRKQAEALIVGACRLSLDGSGTYRLSDWPIGAVRDGLLR